MKAAKFWPRPTGSRMVKRTLPGGSGRQQAEHHRLQRLDGAGPALVLGLEQDRGLLGKGTDGRQGDQGRRSRPQAIVEGQPAGQLVEVDLQLAEPQARRWGSRRPPGLPDGIAPGRIHSAHFLGDGVGLLRRAFMACSQSVLRAIQSRE